MGRLPPSFAARILDNRDRLAVMVQGARVRARVSGPVGGPGILLVHGGGASAVWWDAVVAHLSPEHRIIAVDLSGHGESDWRDGYHSDQWVRELLAVVSVAEYSRPPVVVGHSLGGALAVAAALRSPECFGGVVTVDGNPSGPPEASFRPRSSLTRRIQGFPARASAVEHFVMSKQAWPSWFSQHVAERSVVATDSTWGFRRDPLTRTIPTPVITSQMADALSVGSSLGFVHGALSPFLARDQRYVSQLSQVVAEVVAGAGHEVLAERPEECAWALERVTRGLIRCSRQLATT